MVQFPRNFHTAHSCLSLAQLPIIGRRALSRGVHTKLHLFGSESEWIILKCVTRSGPSQQVKRQLGAVAAADECPKSGYQLAPHCPL